MSGDLTARDVVVSAMSEWRRANLDVQADAVLAALAAAGWELKRKPDPLLDIRDELGHYLGKQGTTHEHRTVGTYRAWCYDAGEWCYPGDPCRLCKEMADA